MEKKESYKHHLPHFQQPGQAYFITWCLNASVPKKALDRYSKVLELLRHQLNAYSGAPPGAASGAAIYNRRNKLSRLKIATPNSRLHPESFREATPEATPDETKMPDAEYERLKLAYALARKKYIKAYDDLLYADRKPVIDLSKTKNKEILIHTLLFWEGKKIKNIAFTIMPNHVHWVLELMEKDENVNPVYLQDVLQSVKRQTARLINIAEKREGTLWQKESFDTTIRDERHLFYAIMYTLNNPVNAGLVTDWKKWEGTWCSPGCGFGCGDLANADLLLQSPKKKCD